MARDSLDERAQVLITVGVDEPVVATRSLGV